jgi:hypothetical protein
MIADEDIITLIGALQENAQRLGLTWTLTPGVVYSTLPLSAIPDSPDDTAIPIPVVSLVGHVGIGVRVMICAVPPAGQYVIGRLNTDVQILGANATNNGTVATAVSATPVPVASASWDSEPTFKFPNGHLFKITFTGNTATAGATAMSGAVQIRKGSASAAGTLLINWADGIPAGFANVIIFKTFVGYIKNTSGTDVSSALTVAAVRNTAASNFSIYGDGANPVVMTVEDIGLVTAQPTLAIAAQAISV